MDVKTGPNEACSCGSGKKYKHCCGGPNAKSQNKRNPVVMALVVLAAVGIVSIVLFGGSAVSTRRDRGVQPLPNRPTSLPVNSSAGQPGPGKVWSPEHGHYHDVTTPSGTSAQTRLPAGSPAPGPPPPGKVWNTEHGHWHNKLIDETKLAPRPDGPPPPGKKWSDEHGHWHDDPDAKKDTTETPALNAEEAPEEQ